MDLFTKPRHSAKTLYLGLKMSSAIKYIVVALTADNIKYLVHSLLTI